MVKVQVGQAEVNASALRDLRNAWSCGELVIFLGAGASIPYGIPSWRDLVLELLFDQAAGTRRLGTLWPHYRRAIASWMTDYFEYDPLVLARMVERSLAKRTENGPEEEVLFLERLRTHLYAHTRPTASRTMLSAVADLLARPGSGVRSVVTFNFDHLLEEALHARGTAYPRSPVPAARGARACASSTSTGPCRARGPSPARRSCSRSPTTIG